MIMASVSSTPASGVAGLLIMTYDATGLESVHVEGWPLIGWQLDDQNPRNPRPITIGDPLAAIPPATGAIESPQWVHITSDNAVYDPDGWRGTFHELLTWLATNNGATRLVTADVTFPVLVNDWNAWKREHPAWVGSET